MNSIVPIREATCPACGYHVATTFFDGGAQPLATIAWPSSAQESESMPRLSLDFVRCVDCGHVYNTAFNYASVPYSEKPNLMFNSGRIWSEYIRDVQNHIVSLLPSTPTVVEIGYGDGSFLSALAALRPDCRCIGFDPNGCRTTDANVSLRQELFVPDRHLAELRPDLIISRHVLEHLTNPLGFLQSINFAAAALRLPVRMYFEVPCIDRAIQTLRTVDFYYEHSSQFTSRSFRKMLERSGVNIDVVRCGYGDEVISAFVLAAGCDHQITAATEAARFNAAAQQSRTTIQLQLLSLHLEGKTVAVWGGTGKSAAFMNRYGFDRHRFPTVVDSDPQKTGTFVPGTGQEIRFRDWLLSHPAEIIIIPPQWRAADIVREMQAAGIQSSQVLIEHDGMLVDYYSTEHPYHLSSTVPAGERNCLTSVG